VTNFDESFSSSSLPSPLPLVVVGVVVVVIVFISIYMRVKLFRMRNACVWCRVNIFFFLFSRKKKNHLGNLGFHRKKFAKQELKRIKTPVFSLSLSAQTSRSQRARARIKRERERQTVSERGSGDRMILFKKKNRRPLCLSLSCCLSQSCLSSFFGGESEEKRSIIYGKKVPRACVWPRACALLITTTTARACRLRDGREMVVVASSGGWW